MLIGSESFTLCWCLSPKLARNKTQHWLCSVWQQKCTQALLQGFAAFFLHHTSRSALFTASPEDWRLDPSPGWQWWDRVGSRRDLTPITNMIQKKKKGRNWKNFQHLRNRVGKGKNHTYIVPEEGKRRAPLKGLNSSNLSVLPRISRQELSPHAPQGKNQLLIMSENVAEMW